MRTKIEIKNFFGKLLFEFEKENNLIKETLIEAVKAGADLYGANLYGADLTRANLYGANLTGANLYGADLTRANLTGIKIKKAVVLNGLYKYVVIPFISVKDEKYIKMGCYTRTVEEWEADFWNNENEFPNDNSEKSNMRLFAYQTALKWFDVIEKSEP